jgi:hypothetical protein
MSEITFLWPENKTPFYRFVSDPVSDPDSDPVSDSDPDSNPDPKCLFYFASGSNPDPAKSFGSLRIRFRIRNTEKNIISITFF